MIDTKFDSLYQVLEALPDEASCIQHLEQLRWPRGIICPNCGAMRKFNRLKRDMKYKCAECNKSFTVRKGTIFEESRLPLRKWVIAAWLMLARLREISQFMSGHGGTIDGVVETDETYLGSKVKNRHKSKRPGHGRGTAGKEPVIGARSRDGRVVTQQISGTSKAKMHQFVHTNIVSGATLYTDDHPSYNGLTDYNHRSVRQSVGEYVRGQIHTNGIESFWALLKRAYLHIPSLHLEAPASLPCRI
jgi:transposase-like protein